MLELDIIISIHSKLIAIILFTVLYLNLKVRSVSVACYTTDETLG